MSLAVALAEQSPRGSNSAEHREAGHRHEMAEDTLSPRRCEATDHRRADRASVQGNRDRQHVSSSLYESWSDSNRQRLCVFGRNRLAIAHANNEAQSAFLCRRAADHPGRTVEGETWRQAPGREGPTVRRDAARRLQGLAIGDSTSTVRQTSRLDIWRGDRRRTDDDGKLFCICVGWALRIRHLPGKGVASGTRRRAGDYPRG